MTLTGQDCNTQDAAMTLFSRFKKIMDSLLIAELQPHSFSSLSLKAPSLPPRLGSLETNSDSLPALASSPATSHAEQIYDSHANWQCAQRADQQRRSWEWVRAKVNSSYAPQEPYKWWSKTEEDFARRTAKAQRSCSHIGRIMEMELGQKLLGEDRCMACQAEGWKY
ncbi:hypothetical protein FQN51_001770 [Onygenales sp. PD_10]|nr:hypothetical protein FQN51_001770 [Onygenales sp. PD_10]